eukprot:CAMPEP_0113318756 /NCGR_PEP_ID=MMETSP0010_2-20120614/13207_1 /TAXON_ID=216773 ORGANISM="Corethron hystrix, Strain 308" /NCGR_SAMPLE_ID=MMETSP0010_2 /ASSEMBLY_ACC=CAM_ASM_000155 /LENGTH=948 /DNA_ID=CAMNT_0000176141 /DNA_START=59 /DNA_END=2902 /DNA_ORIENTATION=- /assembly_acc=CAM_ASM_000155
MKLMSIYFFIFGVFFFQLCFFVPHLQTYLNGIYLRSVESGEEWVRLPKSHILPQPYRIIQIGAPRSGSTFQFQLLNAIVSLKSSANEEITSTFFARENWRIFPLIQDVVNNKSFIVKTHFDHPIFEIFQQRGYASIFASSVDIAPYAVYNQERERLVECPLCEIDRYKSMFQLSEKDVELLMEHMDLYSSLRMCCGEQMSKYEILRLNGCNVTQYVELPDYPHCEDKDLEDIEVKFAGSPIPFHANNPEVNWARPGDCARFSEEIASGKGFNGRTLTSCEIYGKFAGYTRTNGTKIHFDFGNFTENSPWLRKYMQFHNSAIDFRGNLKDDVPYLVYQCTDDMVCGDWGERLMGMVKALFLAMCTGRVLLIDSTSPVPLDTILNPGFIAWNVAPPENAIEIFDALVFDAMNADFPLSKHHNTLGYRIGHAQVIGDENYRLSEILESRCMDKHLIENGWPNASKYMKGKTMTVPYAFHSAFWILFDFDDDIIYRAEKMKEESGLEKKEDDDDYDTYDQNVTKSEFQVFNGLHYGYLDVKEMRSLSNCHNNMQNHTGFNASAYLVSDHVKVKEGVHKVDASIHYYQNDMLDVYSMNDDSTTSLRDQRISFIESMAEIKVLVDSKCLGLSNTMYSMMAYYIRGPENECHVLIDECEYWDLANPLILSYEPGDNKPKNMMKIEQRSQLDNITQFPRMMRNYINFHNRAINFGGRLKDNVPYLIYQCTEGMVCGDWGDRVMGMVKALFLAICTHRVLLIDSTSPIPLETVLNPGFIAWNVAPPENTTEIVDALNANFPISKYKNTLGYRIGHAQVIGDENYRLSEILESPCMAKYLKKNGYSNVSQYMRKREMFVPGAFHNAFWALFDFDDDIIYRAEKMKIESGLETTDDLYFSSYVQNITNSELQVYHGLHYGHSSAKMRNRTSYCHENMQDYMEFNASAYLVSDNLEVKKW